MLKNSNGFTLVETLVAISILTLSIAGAFTAVQSGIQSSTFAKDQITAFWLAQEGMEFIKNRRDENALNSISGGSATWLSGLSAVSDDPCWFGGGGVSQKTCIIDSPIPSNTAPCSLGFGTCPNIKQDATSGLFGHASSWTDTNFKREIQFQSISANEVLITIKISWTNRNLAKSFEVTQSLFNRQ
ncbi:MAG: hypothetical protein UT65_C0009G0004 [Parcubacteria group bacterium GW2011_GWF2_39_8b]|nr:MAG: hypothetical protein UT65_C0009G0004 [Parcubacteria group bacterium GW2011_GWF2_39_8b]OHA96166.1 MAG: hypothetical protein A3C63_02250 [Candidatus Zambryskibacteria bacterium RIFCSPHIGHO2_02_FULL_39_82]OHB11857.1 MAG: hypothetical protein A2Y49_02595 [Candidatus Zambryskibacteria bacterium RIFCSPLOWO2_12_39_8]